MKKQNKPRGFQTMSVEKRKKIASMGGKQAHKNGKAHKWTSETAAKAGRLGGKARAKNFKNK